MQSRDSQESAPTPQFKSISSLAFFMVQLSHLYVTIGKNIALTRRTYVSKVTSLLFNVLSRSVSVPEAPGNQQRTGTAVSRACGALD